MRIALAVGLAMMLVPSAVRAESGVDAFLSCTYGTPEVDPPAGPIPANVPAFTIDLRGTFVDASTARLTRSSDAHVVPLDVARRGGVFGPVVLVPMELLTVGETYVLDHPACGASPPRSTTYDVVAAIPGPASAGTIAMRGPYAAYFGSRGACHRATFVEVDLADDPAFADPPWSGFSWGVEIDGRAGALTVPVSTTTERLFVICPRDGVIAAGPHDLRALAVPVPEDGPSGWAPFASPSIHVDIDCAAAVVVDDATLVPLTADEIAFWDADPAGSCGMDAAIARDGGGGLDAGSGVDGSGGSFDADTVPIDSGTGASASSSGCRASPRRSPPSALALVAFAALIARFRARAAAAPRR